MPEKLWTKNGPFQKLTLKRRNLKTPALRFRLDRKQFEDGAFRTQRQHDNHVIFQPESSSNTNPKYSFCRR